MQYRPGSSSSHIGRRSDVTEHDSDEIERARMQDAQHGTASHNVTITLTGTKYAPIITAAVASGQVIEDTGPTSASGTVHFVDVDLAESHTGSATPAGGSRSGTLTGRALPMLRPATAR